ARSRLCSQLLKELSNLSANDLTYDNPLASGIICDESELVKNLPQDCQEEFRTGILEMKLDSNSDLRQASESLVKSHQSWKKQKKKRPSSKARKQLHGNKPDFMLRVKIGDKELELVNMETERPKSDWKKQLSDHNKLARSAKDAFEDFSINGSVKKYGYDELTKIFCLNVKGK
ncbi:3631_t:CDS:2, partial [Racocetra fulgida]